MKKTSEELLVAFIVYTESIFKEGEQKENKDKEIRALGSYGTLVL